MQCYFMMLLQTTILKLWKNLIKVIDFQQGATQKLYSVYNTPFYQGYFLLYQWLYYSGFTTLGCIFTLSLQIFCKDTAEKLAWLYKESRNKHRKFL